MDKVMLEWKCKQCGEMFFPHEVARVYGKESRPYLLGYCSAKCYTDSRAVIDPKIMHVDWQMNGKLLFERLFEDERLTPTDDGALDAVEKYGKAVLKMVKYDLSYLNMALIWGKNSMCKRKKVGCLIVKGNKIISDGFNGMPSGFDNECEGQDGETKWEVLHAEANALMKLTKSSDSAHGSTIYLTFTPCKHCAKLIIQAGIKRLVTVGELHSDTDGLRSMHEAGIVIDRYVDINPDLEYLNQRINSELYS